MKKNLNEEIARIKDMMGKVMNESVVPEGPSEDAKQLTLKILAELSNGGDMEAALENAYHSGGAIELPITDEDGNILQYDIDVYVTSGSSFSPGRNYMSNGDPGYPDEYDPAEYEFSQAYLQVITADGQILYKGKDFTDILNFELPNGETMDTWLFNKFDESISEWESSSDRY